MHCQRCGSDNAEKMFLALGYADGIDEGVHVADCDAALCPSCIEAVQDLLLTVMGLPLGESEVDA